MEVGNYKITGIIDILTSLILFLSPFSSPKDVTDHINNIIALISMKVLLCQTMVR